MWPNSGIPTALRLALAHWARSNCAMIVTVPANIRSRSVDAIQRYCQH